MRIDIEQTGNDEWSLRILAEVSPESDSTPLSFPVKLGAPQRTYQSEKTGGVTHTFFLEPKAVKSFLGMVRMVARSLETGND